MTKIIMHGYSGRMGQVICSLVNEDPECEIVAGIDISDNNATFPTYNDINECDMPADVIIDFSTASAVDNVVKYAVGKKIPAVICTTGLSKETLKNIDDASKVIPVFKSANMSIGINMLANILKKYASLLYDSGFDIEITERHHNLKIDSPSGTAIFLGDSINEAVGGNLEYVYDRSNVREKRRKEQIGFSAVRGGTIVGDHSVIFAGKDEVIEFKHSAYSKEVFAVGAVRAAKFISGKPAGNYDMQSIMNCI